MAKLAKAVNHYLVDLRSDRATMQISSLKSALNESFWRPTVVGVLGSCQLRLSYDAQEMEIETGWLHRMILHVHFKATARDCSHKAQEMANFAMTRR